MLNRTCVGVAIFAAVMLPTIAHARIKLITLPVRERVEIQLDHPGATLIEEERIVPLVAGVNHVDFSWANTNIDPNTIVFRVVDAPQDVTVLSVSYPPNENALVWQVGSSASGSARVRISYIIGHLNKSFTYRAVASHDERTLVLSQYIRLENFANESFGDSHVFAGFGRQFLQQIGLGETTQVLMARFENVAARKTYTCSVAEFDYIDRAKNKLRVPMHYVLHNDAAHGLGGAPLPYGKVRIFQDDGRGTTAFLGEDWGRFTPLDDQMRLYLGVAQDIAVKREIHRRDRTRVAGNLFDHDIVVRYEIENFKDQPVTLDIAEDLQYLRREVIGETGRDIEWTFGDQHTLGDPDAEKSSSDKLVFHVDLPGAAPGGRADDGGAGNGNQKVTVYLHVRIHNEW
jgi:hypothetical protein